MDEFIKTACGICRCACRVLVHREAGMVTEVQADPNALTDDGGYAL
jgi:hypothetical protein